MSFIQNKFKQTKKKLLEIQGVAKKGGKHLTCNLKCKINQLKRK